MGRDLQRPRVGFTMGRQLGTSFEETALRDGSTFRTRKLQRPNGRTSQDCNVESGLLTTGPANLSIAILALAGIVLPQEVQISFGAGARLTAGRVAAVLLIVPAILTLCKKGRHFVVCDFLACATA